jgi:guanylate kinase
MGCEKTQEKQVNESQNLNYNSLIKKIQENGDLVILGQKGTCKTTLLQHLARQLRTEQNNHVIIFETFPKWIHEFDSIPYMIIKDDDVQSKEEFAYIEPDKSIIQWSKDFTISNAETVNEFLKINKDVIFLIECEDMEKISAFMTFVIYQIYRKQYLRAKADRLDRIDEHYWFLCEESHNLLDSSVIAKKTFNKLRKIQNEFRNLKMHLICVALRLQDLSPKIRSKMSIVLSRVSLDDYQLKVRSLLRNSEFRDIITELPKGQFIYPELDLKLTTEPFKQEDKPFEYHSPEQPQPQTQPFIDPWKQPKIKLGLLQRFTKWLFASNSPHDTQYTQRNNTDNSKEDSEFDGVMTLDDDEALFPPEEF